MCVCVYIYTYIYIYIYGGRVFVEGGFLEFHKNDKNGTSGAVTTSHRGCIDAIFKRSALLVDTKAWVYWRPAGVNPPPIPQRASGHQGFRA